MIEPDALLTHDFGERRHSWSARDAILYALGLGLGRDPTDEADLRFLDERRLSVLPSFAVTLGSPGMWIRNPRFGVDFSRLVHIEQDAYFHSPLPPEGQIVATARVASLSDRGEGHGAELVVSRLIRSVPSGDLLCELEQTLLLRGDGGFGGTRAERRGSGLPDRPPDVTTTFDFSRRAALIYRLSGDWNPLHIDPGFARAAGFDRPIMHGLGVYGSAGIAVTRAVGIEPDRITRLACRFVGTVLPGDHVAFDVWEVDGGFAFAGRNRGKIVLDRGRMETL